MDKSTEVMLGVIEGGRCYGYYVARHKACSVCGIVKFCETATRKKTQKSVPPPTPPPQPEPQPEPVEDIPQVSPFDYLIESIKGRHDVIFTSGEKYDTYDVELNGKLAARIYHAKDGRIRLMRPGGNQVFPELKSISDAEKVLKFLS